ncbi:MAG: dephospho-CoA kinase [Chitinophagaceae bacterium]|nr:MAG: dephospho-CoA kinase [Chitinophagaceae bacterium]
MIEKVKVGITGGIGSGKSIVSKVLMTMGYLVYNSDVMAKKLMIEDSALKNEIIAIFGKESYTTDNQLNRAFISKQAFNDKDLLKKLNEAVHPAVRSDFKKWAISQESELIFKEAALLVETGSYKELDFLIAVTAPKDLRIKRVMKRDKVDREAVLERMKNQFSQEKLLEAADFEIKNNDEIPVIPQLLNVLKFINKETLSKNL